MTVVRGGALGELAESTAKSADNLDLSRAAANVSARNVGDVNLRNVSVRPPGAIGRTLTNTAQSVRAAVSSTARAAGDALQGLWGSIRGGPKKAGNLVDGAKAKSKPLPEAEAPKTKQDLVDAGLKDGPDTDAALKHADDVAKDPSVSRTLQKWGVRGGVGVMFLMMLYDTANPFEAIAKGAEDTKDAVKGTADIMSSIFEGLKGMLAFLKNNGIISLASSCCCLLLMLLPSIMASVPRRPTRFGGAYY